MNHRLTLAQAKSFLEERGGNITFSLAFQLTVDFANRFGLSHPMRGYYPIVQVES
jgi:hypothetical protein